MATIYRGIIRSPGVECRKFIVAFGLLFGVALAVQGRAVSLDRLPRTEEKNFTPEYWAAVSAQLAAPLLNGNRGIVILQKLEAAETRLNELAVAKYAFAKDRADVRLYLLNLLREYTGNPRYLELIRSPERLEITRLGYPDGIFRRRSTGGYAFDRVIDYPRIMLRTLVCLDLADEQLDECLGVIAAIPARDVVERYERGMMQCLLAFDDIELEREQFDRLAAAAASDRDRLEIYRIVRFRQRHGMEKPLPLQPETPRSPEDSGSKPLLELLSPENLKRESEKNGEGQKLNSIKKYLIGGETA